ncbi:hypothetical protein GCM10009737_10620 [Nocardioides lentus]|uniref:Secreted protein n=1 Tax=Nocardioides lentus TaxID=338077 RepID=A0ABN2P4W2_9ACTN
MWVAITLAVAAAAFLAYDWRRGSALKKRLAEDTFRPNLPHGTTPSPDARHSMSAHDHLSRSHGNTAAGGSTFM